MPILMLFFMLAFQEEITSETLETNTVQDRFQQAVKIYNSVQRDQSRELFEGLANELESREELSEDERVILTESFKFLGVLSFPDGTRDYFERLIRFDSAYEVSPNDLPPKIVTVFDALKKSMVATLEIKATDAATFAPLTDVTLWVDGNYVGKLSGEGVFDILAGTHQVELRKINYSTYESPVEVSPGDKIQLEGSLARTAAELVFTTSPPEVDVFINDQPVGSTNQPLRFDYRAEIRKLGVAEEDAGSTQIHGLELGTYTVRFEKPCYKSAVFSIPVEELKETLIKPIRLEPSEAYLNVTTPKQATGIVFLDQTRIGILPVSSYKVCPGDYTLRVKFSDGEFVKRLTIGDGETRDISAEPLPSIAWFGLMSRDEGDPPQDPDEMIKSLKSWNVIDVDPYDANRVPVNPFAILFNAENDTISDEGRAALTRHLRMDLYAAARVVRKKVVIRHLEVAFWTPLSDKIRVVSFDFRAFDRIRQLLANMDGMPPLTQPWLGIQAGKMEGVPGCRVLAVSPASPFADKVGRGDIITRINGVPLRNPGELERPSSPDRVTLEVNGTTLSAAAIGTIAEVPFDPETYCPQALLAMFEKLSKYNPDPLVRQSALFNQARYQLFLGDYKEAFDIFSTMTLSMNYGVNQGTLFYYQGLCFQRLKLATEATSAFTQVLSFKNATLFNAYGPQAAFWAENELKNTNF
ncbi:hypothetical protein SCOR_15570 [Sulfidibacter corallicola]|uniref:PEGA domain-containing protein n=1 Tax=Sulfidibacter corallicola TaxID=2818388 RepID=A0A8A4TYF0_SULCO|nr:hypothetical protein [Sulfidibacter corallicola]QTD54114.1 hypothetical protein J3U87_16840 [Sulfidibacter corallicola]